MIMRNTGGTEQRSCEDGYDGDVGEEYRQAHHSRPADQLQQLERHEDRTAEHAEPQRPRSGVPQSVGLGKACAGVQARGGQRDRRVDPGEQASQPCKDMRKVGEGIQVRGPALEQMLGMVAQSGGEPYADGEHECALDGLDDCRRADCVKPTAAGHGMQQLDQKEKRLKKVSGIKRTTSMM